MCAYVGKSLTQRRFPRFCAWFIGIDDDDVFYYGIVYNLTTNYSYYITFRAFGDVQFQFGRFLSTNKSEENSIEIFHRYSTKESYHLFIICFHFLLQFNNLDIQCKDIRLLQNDQLQSNSSEDFLPSYSPLFVPMMYALSIVMLLPVIVQHHRHKKALLLKRRQTIRRLSLHIAQDDQNPQQSLIKNMLLQIDNNDEANYENLSIEMDGISIPMTQLNRNDVNGNNVTFTLQNLQPFIHRYDDDDDDDDDLNEQSGMNADDCIAHLLDNTPWNTPHIEQPLTTSLLRHSVVRDGATAIKEQHVPTIISYHDDDDDNDQKPILKSNKQSTKSFYRTNRVFFESDV
ncbi:hypothetical protein I4U23_020646 [Adineta vaga]|nr:hypothetical protein I4U23_020646 [Adineta vaga]